MCAIAMQQIRHTANNGLCLCVCPEQKPPQLLPDAGVDLKHASRCHKLPQLLLVAASPMSVSSSTYSISCPQPFRLAIALPGNGCHYLEAAGRKHLSCCLFLSSSSFVVGGSEGVEQTSQNGRRCWPSILHARCHRQGKC